MDPSATNMSACLLGPVANTDISGIGNRLATYMQTTVLSFLAFQGTQSDLEDSIFTFVVTNICYGLVTLFLGYGATSQLTLYDSLIIIYLLSGSWIPLFLSMLRYNAFHARPDSAKDWKYGVISAAFTLQAFVHFGLVLLVLYSAPSYGSDAACNEYRALALFHPFKATNSVRAVVMTASGMILLTAVLSVTARPMSHIAGGMFNSFLNSVVIVVVLMSLWIANVELSRKYNKPQAGEESWVSLGQIMPVLSLLTSLPKVYEVLRKEKAALSASVSLCASPTTHVPPDIELLVPPSRTRRSLAGFEDTSGIPGSDYNAPLVPTGSTSAPRAPSRIGSEAIPESAQMRRRNADVATYPCSRPGCTATFTRRHNLKNHEKSHDGQQAYVCEFCGAWFVRSYDRTRHMARSCPHSREAGPSS